jgi:hypothetical protein
MQELIKVPFGDNYPDHYLITSEKPITALGAIQDVAQWLDECGIPWHDHPEGELVVGYVLTRATAGSEFNARIARETGIKIEQLPPCQTWPYGAGSGYSTKEG